MTDIELVIKIPEEEYKKIIEDGECDYLRVINAIENGIPLPEGHGRLIDADKLYPDSDYEDGLFYAVSTGQIGGAETIVEAESEVTE